MDPNKPNDDNQNPTNPTPVAPAAQQPTAEAPAQQPDLGTPAPEAAQAGGPVEEKCVTCGGPASTGNCTNCGQNQYGCSCQAQPVA